MTPAFLVDISISAEPCIGNLSNTIERSDECGALCDELGCEVVLINGTDGAFTSPLSGRPDNADWLKGLEDNDDDGTPARGLDCSLSR